MSVKRRAVRLISWSSRYLKTAPVVVLIYVFFTLVYSRNYRPTLQETGDNLKAISSPPKTKCSDCKKVILSWSGEFGSPRKWERYFHDMVAGQCPESRCEITTNRSLLESADALLFHYRDMSEKQMTLPSHRPPGQVWILWLMESAVRASSDPPLLKMLNGKINLTMSYNRWNDVLFPYGLVLKRNATPTQRIARLVPRDLKLTPNNLVRTKKTRLVAWMVSNCRATSHRMDFMNEFQKYAEVDIYGNCGHLKCGVPEYRRFGPENFTDCYDVLATYKFYMAFENSLCPDYITEKFYRSLVLGIVPIILADMGHATIAPPSSYIDASKFTPESLARYLNYLDKNTTAYREYLQWRTDYDVFNAFPDRFLTCGLCDTLHNLNTLNSGKPRDSVYHDLSSTWLPVDQCLYWNKNTLSLSPIKT